MMLSRFLFVCVFASLMPVFTSAQQPDSLLLKDSIRIIDSARTSDSALQAFTNLPDSIKDSLAAIARENAQHDSLHKDSIYQRNKSKAFSFIQNPRKRFSKDIIFYALALIALLFAIVKVLYPRYFSNLFRVFFNTSLRQSQLTDQLLQAKLPSLLYNIFFIVTGGWYLYLLLEFFGKTGHSMRWDILLICAAGLLIIYLVKFCILKFTGWITGFRDEADTYIFIIFLINKIVAICLVPLIIIIAFSDKDLVNIAILLSYIVIGVMILMRFFRSYSLLQNRLKVSRFHFFLYIAGVEIVPILVIYKLVLIFMSKSL